MCVQTTTSLGQEVRLKLIGKAVWVRVEMIPAMTVLRLLNPHNRRQKLLEKSTAVKALAVMDHHVLKHHVLWTIEGQIKVLQIICLINSDDFDIYLILFCVQFQVQMLFSFCIKEKAN